MNELIRQFAEQSEGSTICECGASGFNYEKFAELIIQECMNLVKNCYAEPESGQSPYRTACTSTIIEKHFGVDE